MTTRPAHDAASLRSGAAGQRQEAAGQQSLALDDARITANVRVGTCSWTDRTLIASGRFYPRGCSSAEARLRYYASRFPLVEVDSSYYAMPSRENSVRWVERTPADFVFNIKAFRLMTGHQTPQQALPRDILQALGLGPPVRDASAPPLYARELPAEMIDELWRRYREAIEPLAEAGKLGLVHFQFPPWVRNNAEGHALVADCVARMQGYLLSVEFRHRGWFDSQAATARTLAFQRSLGVVHTVVDAPQGFANSVPAVWEATHPAMAYLRLHGRNARTWNVKGATAASERFNYDYPDDELAELVSPILALARRVGTMHVAFNVNFEDQGQRNARSLMQMLHDAVPD